MAEVNASKAPPPPQPVVPGTVFIKNPTGAVHDVSEDDSRTASAIEQAQKSSNGWRLASDEEIAAYCEANNIESPSKKAKAIKAPE